MYIYALVTGLERPRLVNLGLTRRDLGLVLKSLDLGLEISKQDPPLITSLTVSFGA